MGQQSSQEANDSEAREEKRLSQESSDDSYATRLAGSFYGDDSDSQEKHFNSPVLNALDDQHASTQLSDGSSQPLFPTPPHSRVTSLSPRNNETAIRANETVVQGVIDDDLEEGVPVKTSRGTRPSLPTRGNRSSLRPYNLPFRSSAAPTSPTSKRHETRILPSGLKPPRPQPRIAPLPPLESGSASSTPPDSPRRSSEDSFATPVQATLSEQTPPAPTPPQTPDRQNDEEAPLQTDAVLERRHHRQKQLSCKGIMLLGFGLTALIGPFSMLVPVLWPEYRKRRAFASFSVGVLSALVVWLAFSIVLALVLVNQ